MSFLDNLENNLKALESLEQGGLDESKRREADRARAVAEAPWAEQLKNGPYAKALMQQSARAGHARRMKIDLVWIGTTLRLEARGQRLELRPAADGVRAVFLNEGEEIRTVSVDLAGDSQNLLDAWLEVFAARI